MEIAAQAMGRMAACSSSYRTEHIEFHIRRAIEWLASEKNEGKRQAAVCILCDRPGVDILSTINIVVHFLLWPNVTFDLCYVNVS